jgi:hypothetical protein
MRIDSSPILLAGQAQAKVGEKMGQTVGGIIEQYSLNKEKQKEDKATIKSTVGILERIKKLDPENETQYAIQIEQLNNEDVGLGMRARIADKTLQGLSITSQLQGQMMDQKFTAERIKASEDVRKANEDLSKIKNRDARRSENTYKVYKRQLDDLQNRILNGAKYKDFSVQDRLILGNSAGIINRTLPLEELIYDPSKDLDFETAQEEFENIKKQGKKTDQDIEIGNLVLGEKKTDIARTPDFTDRDSAIASTSDLPDGVSADIKKFKNGFNVEYKYKAKEFTDIPSVPGFPNYKKVGQYLYEADPKTKKLKKLDPEDFGEKSELLQSAIKTLTTKDVEQYGLAKFRGVINDDDDYEVEDPASGETIVIPFNQELEDRLTYIGALRNKLETQLDIDLDLTIP